MSNLLTGYSLVPHRDAARRCTSTSLVEKNPARRGRKAAAIL